MIIYDRSYISGLQRKFIEKGISLEGVYQLRFEGKESDCLKARDYFNDNYKVFQLNTDRYEKDYELFYWSNKSITGELTYFTITITGYKDIDQVDYVVGKANEIVNAVDEICPNLTIAIQYKSLEIKNIVQDLASELYEKRKNSFVTNNYGVVGKIKRVRDGYGFFKKGARTRYYPLKESSVIELCGL